MGRIGTISALLLVVALAVGLGTAGDAGAKTKTGHAKHRGTSQVTLQSVGPNRITGRVSGGQRVCRRQREVTVYRVNSGPSVPSSEFVASTWTQGDGSWVVPGPMFPSQFFAVVEAKRANRVVCGSATSNPLVWG